MRCVFTSNELIGGHRVKSELWTESKEGTRAPLLPVIDGVKTILTVKADGYKLANVEGEILRQGITTDVFEVANSMLFDAEPMQVIDNVRGFEGRFSEYEQIYGFGRVERSKNRKFRLYVEKSDRGSGIGLVEYSGFDTYAIHSLLYSGPFNNRVMIDFVAEYVSSMLKASEKASIYYTGVNSSYKLDSKYADFIKYHSKVYKDNFEQARLIAHDALLRRTDIAEIFEEPMRYEPQGLFVVEQKQEPEKPEKPTRTSAVNDIMQAMKAQLMELESEAPKIDKGAID